MISAYISTFVRTRRVFVDISTVFVQYSKVTFIANLEYFKIRHI